MDDILGYRILNNAVSDWLLMLGMIGIAITCLRLIQNIVIKKLILFARTTKTTIDDFVISIIHSSLMPLLYILAIYAGLQYPDLPAKWRSIEHVAIMLIVTFYVLRIVSSFIGYLFKNSFLQKEENEQRKKQSRGILLIVQVIVWLGGVLFLVDNLGYDITTLVAGLGIGGIAIALAAQTILGDLFSYLVIFFDKPFEIGDFIIVDDKMGTVEYIGIKTTRLRTLGGEQLICSNTDLTNSRVHNYKRMQERRVVFSFGVVYDTTASKLRRIPGILRQIIESLPDIRFDRAHFKSFGNSSLDFEVVYYILTADFNIYMDKQQAINMSIFESFEQEQIEFAFPTQTLFLHDNEGNYKGNRESKPEQEKRNNSVIN